MKLEEGAKMVSNPVGVKPHEIRYAMPVVIIFDKYNEEAARAKLRPRAAVHTASH